MTSLKLLLALSLGLFSAAAASDGLDSLLVDGHELHPTLATPQPGDGPVRHVPRDVVRQNPQLSSDPAFVEAIARSGSQGRRDATGIRAALYARYVDGRDVGFYGLEAATDADADRLDEALRDIWSHNIGIDRTRVHRAGRVLVVVWSGGVSPMPWEAVNAGVAERLAAP